MTTKITSNNIVERSITSNSIALNAIRPEHITLNAITTSNVFEDTNLFFTNARSRSALTVAGAGTYDSNTGIITIDGRVISVSGAEGTISNSQILSGLLTVDGIGSNLDADLLDGEQGSFYSPLTTTTNAYNQANTATTNAATATTYATSAFGQANTAYVAATSAFASSNTKVATVAGVTDTSISNAALLAGLLTVDGSGSGLDADLLDGQSSAYYATASSLSSYLPLSGIPDNSDQYVSFRVIRNANSSTSNDGMYIGYSNSNSGLTRIFGQGATSGEFIKYSNYSYDPGSFRAPIFYDSNNTAYYVDPASTSNLGYTVFNVSGYPIVGLNNTNAGTYGLVEWTENGTHKMWMGMGGSSQSLGENSAYAQDGFSINHDGGGAFTISNRGGSKWIRLSTGEEGASGFHTFNVRNGHVIVNQNAITYSTHDNTPIVGGGATTNRLHVNGSIQLTNNDDALVIGRGTATFLKDEELGFGWGGGWYMTDGDWIRTRNSKGIYSGSGIIRSDGDIRSPIFYDQNDTGYYCNPNSSSNLYDLEVRAGGAYANLSDLGYVSPIQIKETQTGTGSARFVPMISQRTVSPSGYRQHTVFGSYRGTVWGSAFIAVGGNDNYPTTALYFDYGGTLSVPTSVNTPIFYDSNDTTYYADLNSTGTSIRIAGALSAYYSDERLKNILGSIDNPLDRLKNITGFYYEENETAEALGYKKRKQVGVSAQKVQEVLPEIVTDAPINAKYLTIDYSKLTPLIIEAVKELETKFILEIKTLKKQIADLQSKI